MARYIDVLFGLVSFGLIVINIIPVDHRVVAEAPCFEKKAPATSKEDKKDVNVTAILEGFLENYDKRIRPEYGGTPVCVGVTMHIISISQVSEVAMDFTSDFYFRQFWNDARIAFNETTGEIETLTIAAEMAKKLWVPDTFFANEKSAYLHSATTENTFLRISRDGSVLRSLRLTVTANCPMQLHYFPMDRQICDIQIESFGYTTNDITYYWQNGKQSIDIGQDVELPQFKVIGHKQQSFHIRTSTGNYSRLACKIQLVRSMGYYLIQIYIPSSLIVIISWVSFWLNRNATPARVSLGVTTVLTMTTLMSSTNAALPKISYVKSIDIFLGTCFVMVFASLLEYATVGYLGKRTAMRKNRNQALQRLAEQRRAPDPCQMGMGIQASSSNPEGHHSHGGLHMKTTEVRFKNRKGYENTVNGAPDLEGQMIRDFSKVYGVSPSDIDKYSRVVFPVCFICFNLMYWIIYLHISDVLPDDLVLFERKKKH